MDAIKFLGLFVIILGVVEIFASSKILEAIKNYPGLIGIRRRLLIAIGVGWIVGGVWVMLEFPRP